MYFNFAFTLIFSIYLLVGSQQTIQAKDKIALLFLTRNTLNHSELWKKLLKESPGKYSIYFHSKEPIDDPDFKLYRISKIVPTSWSIHAKAWQVLVQEAIKDPENVKFAFLSEACIPLYSLDYIYEKIMEDSRTHMAFARPWWPVGNPRELHTIDPKYRHGNTEWLVMNRKHAELVAKDRAIIRIVSRHENDQESYFSTLFSIHDALVEDICNHSYTYVNWEYAINNGASPFHFTEVDAFSDALIEDAYRIGALFARKFSIEYPTDELLKMIRLHTPSVERTH